MPSASLPNEDYTVGWICALPLEAAAATAMLDEIHEKPRKQLSNDHNVYTLGRVGEHNAVIACLPAGVYGTNPAATVATQMLSNFESIRVGLMVGIGGGVPSAERDIRLGDVVVSKPGGTFGGVVQYDRGKTVEGKFERTGSLNKPPQVLLSAVSAMEKRHIMGENKFSEFLADMLRKYPKMHERFSYQSTQNDPLFATHGRHSGDDDTSESRPVKRLKYRSPSDPVVHYGLIASGNQVIKDAATRDQFRQELGGDVLCFEMEAAGLMDTFPCVVIRGICDYADYRKNDLWQGYAAAAAAACAKELLSIIQRNRVADTLTAADRLSASRTVCFAVPFERDPKFIGREDVITEIDRRFEVQRRVALAGIGGVGKSQIAIEYCYRFRDQHPESHVFWIHASTIYRVDQAYKDIARKLCLPGWNDPNVDTFQLVSEWLSNDAHGLWLLVLDNADDMETFFSTNSSPSSVGSEQTVPLVTCLPHSPDGSILITTRDKRVGERLANREKATMVLPMAEREAERLLWSKAAQEGSLDKTNELLEVLGYLPLAITQAAAYISENSITVEKYLKMLCAEDSEIQDLLSEDLPDLRRDSKSQNSVIRTWKISFDQIRKQKPRAAEIFSLMAVLDRQRIPETLLRRDCERETEFATALGALQAFSLISVEKGGASFEIHRLVQISAQRWLEFHGETAKWREEALKLLTAAFPSGDYRIWAICEALSPHAQAVTRYTFISDLTLLQRAELLHSMASYDETQGRYNLAYERDLDALSTREKLLGSEHPDTLLSIRNLARVLRRQGKYDAAEEMQLRALELSKKVLGLEHPDTLRSMDNLARVLRSQGKYEAAEEMHRRTLELSEKVLGPEHPDTLVSMNNLALVLRSQGKYEAAEEVYWRVLELRKKVLGPEYPDTLNSMYSLARVLRSQGKYEAAEEMHRRVLELSEKELGLEHPDTLTSMNNLATVLRSQGKYEAAEEMHRRTLELSEKVLGPEHPDTLNSIDNLALVLSDRGKYEAAEEMQLQVLELRKKVLSPEHPNTLVSMNDLAGVLRSQGKYEAAEEMQLRALELSEKVLGPEHPDTLNSMNNLATVLRSQGKYEAAEEMQLRALKLSEKVLGPEHPDTLNSMDNLAKVLRSQGKYEAAEEMQLRALELSEKVLGPEHPDRLISMNNLAMVLSDRGKYEAAEEMQLRVLELRKKVLSPEHPTMLNSMNNLAMVLRSQGKYEAATEMHRRALKLSEKVLGPEHPDTLIGMNNLAMVLRSQGKYEAAEEMQLRVLKLSEKVLGPEHPTTLISMNNLAMVLRSQGKYDAAEEVQLRVLELSEKVLGPEHPDTLISMNNLALVLSDQGKYEAAEEMHRRALELRKKVLGPGHPVTLISMNNLALVLKGQDKYEAAEEMHRRV